MKNCCEQMDYFLTEGKVAITYQSDTRLYAINLKGSSAIQKINFCPWCGHLLPKDLSEEHFLEIVASFGREPNLDELDQIPTELKTDEWWKKRGL
jgi:hypothetical protein